METRVVMVYGDLDIQNPIGKNVNFFLIRIPVKGVPWRKMMQACQRLVKKISGTPKSKAAPYWNVDGDPPEWNPEKWVCYVYSVESGEFEEIPMKENTCKCGGDGTEYHTCPFSEDVHGDSTTLCNCCSICTRNCAEDI